MTWTLTGDIDRFEEAAGAFLRARPTEHTVLLSVLLSVAASLRAIGPDAYGDRAPWFGWWQPAGRPVEAAVVRTPPRPALLSPMGDDAATALVDALARRALAVPGVNACRPAAEAYASAWRRRHGGMVATAARRRLYRLGTLTPPEPAPPGAARPATFADRDLLLDWFAAFAADIGSPEPRGAGAVDDRLADGRCTLWEVEGRPVSLAGITRTVAGSARVAPVYTPPELRGRGYAAGVTSALSRAARDSGAQEVLLFTDLANATSNALYRRIGYRPVEDHVDLEFLPAGQD
ncbi:GNAT family N-acetyltransferase [Streptomyces sp. NPDC048248]|uniref:GNAT family N-acetyltransferase n=1 Tax=Streptomyces sp. NPDC048248 TaxID=3365523 RepID=UPI0037174D5F